MLEHPDIINCLKTGYPEEEKPVCYCDICGAPICEGQDYFDFGGQYICYECMSDCRKTAEGMVYD